MGMPVFILSFGRCLRFGITTLPIVSMFREVPMDKVTILVVSSGLRSTAFRRFPMCVPVASVSVPGVGLTHTDVIAQPAGTTLQGSATFFGTSLQRWTSPIVPEVPPAHVWEGHHKHC